MFNVYVEALFNGLSFSSILVLTALGLAITFGVMRVINMAHGEMLMLGAYVGYAVEDRRAIPTLVHNLGVVIHNLGEVFGLRLATQEWNLDAGLQLNLFWAIPVSFVLVSGVGYLLEVFLIRFLYQRPLDTLLATWGVGLILQQFVKLLFGPDFKPLSIPGGLEGSWELAGLTFPRYRIFIVGTCILCLALVWAWFYCTSFGLKVRAVTQNRPMASALGISTRQVDSLTFALGTGMAGVAGCILGHLYPVKSDMGADYVVDAFMVVILGGVGQLPGTVTAGAAIGTGNSVFAKFLGNEPMAKVLVLLLVIAFIQFRPSGIFAPKERTYD
jgi:urea transport system permease protein